MGRREAARGAGEKGAGRRGERRLRSRGWGVVGAAGEEPAPGLAGAFVSGTDSGPPGLAVREPPGEGGSSVGSRACGWRLGPNVFLTAGVRGGCARVRLPDAGVDVFGLELQQTRVRAGLHPENERGA